MPTTTSRPYLARTAATLGAAIIAMALSVVPSGTANADSNPIMACRSELNRIGEAHGVCVWPQPGFQGQIKAFRWPFGIIPCQNVTPPGRSVANLTPGPMGFYADGHCQALITLVRPFEPVPFVPPVLSMM